MPRTSPVSRGHPLNAIISDPLGMAVCFSIFATAVTEDEKHTHLEYSLHLVPAFLDFLWSLLDSGNPLLRRSSKRNGIRMEKRQTALLLTAYAILRLPRHL